MFIWREELSTKFLQRSNFLISISLQPDVLHLWNLKLWILTDQLVHIWNNKGLHHNILKIYGLDNLSLWQKTEFLSILKFFPYKPFGHKDIDFIQMEQKQTLLGLTNKYVFVLGRGKVRSSLSCVTDLLFYP